MREPKGIFIQPISLLIIVIASIFATSAFVNLFLSIFSPLSIDLKYSLLDAGLMAVILFPVIYYLVYEPLTSSIRDITRSEEALQESEEKFRSLVETTDDSIYVVNNNFQYLFMNAKHRSRLGLVFDEEYRGKVFSDFHIPSESAVFHEKVSTVFEKGEPLQQELRSMRDGRYFLRTFSPIKGPAKAVRAVSIVSKDITSLKKGGEAELRYRAIFEQSPHGILIIAMNGDIIEFNETAHRELGYSKEEFGKLSLFDINPQSPEEIRDRIKEVINKGSHEFDVKHKTKDGEVRDVHVNARVLDLFDRRVFQAIWHDITEQKRAEEELRQASMTDEITGLSNRRGFLLLAKQHIKLADRLKKSAVLIYAYMNNLKWVNDTFGHKEGDRALIDFASILKSTLRASDIIARWDGYEFVGLLLESAEGAGEIVRAHLREKINAHDLAEVRQFKLSISFGLARYNPENPCTIEDLLERANRLMLP